MANIDFSALEISSIAAAFLLSLAILSFADPLGRRLGVIDHPDNVRKIHERATPLMGGIAIMVPVLLWALAAMGFPVLADGSRLPVVVLVCGFGAALIGFLDDRSASSPSLRLLAFLGLTLLALLLDSQLLPRQFNWGHLAPSKVAPWLSYILVAIGTAGFVNSVNMADGHDGCVAGMFAIWSGCMILSGGGGAADLAAILFVTSLGMLVFNLRGKVFLGGAGAYGATFVFAILILRLHNRWGVTAETIIVWLFIPIADCLRLLVTRPLHGRSPFAGDRNHFHHRLHERFGKHGGLSIYLGLVLTSSLIATLLPNLAPGCLAALAVAYLGLMLATGSSDAHAAVAPAKIRPRD